MGSTNALYVGNLRSDCEKKYLKDGLFELLSNKLHINVKKGNIKVKENKNCKVYAKIQLPSQEDLDYALDNLESWEKRKQVRFNFTLIAEPNQNLIFNEVGTHVNGRPNKNTGNTRNEFVPNQTFQRTPNHESNADINNHVPGPSGQSEKTKIYHEGELLGAETRCREFKEGGGDYLNKNLKDHVSKYICGFLNSLQEGTLFIGVNDDGRVVGVYLDRKTEDKVRLRIDETMRTFLPPVLTNNYHVEFVPLYTKDGRRLIENYKVIEISVKKKGNLTELYEANGTVYLRRDARTEILKPYEVQQWLKEHHQEDMKVALERHQRDISIEKDEEIRQLKKEKDNLKLQVENNRKDSEMKNDNKAAQNNKNRSNEEIHVLEKENENLRKQIEKEKESNKQLQKELKKKSKVCAIM